MKEIELERNDVVTLDSADKMSTIIKYLAMGKTLEHDGRFYRMDGNMNMFIVPVDEKGNPMDREHNDFPIFVNDMAWALLLEMVTKFSNEKMIQLKLDVASCVAIMNHEKTKY